MQLTIQKDLVEDKEAEKVVLQQKVTKVRKPEPDILRKSDSKVDRCLYREDFLNSVSTT